MLRYTLSGETTMKEYVDLVLRKANKRIDKETLFSKVEALIQKEDSSYELTEEDKDEIESVLEAGLDSYDYYVTPYGRYTLLSKTSYRKGKFRGNRVGEGNVTHFFTIHDKHGKPVTVEEKYKISKENTNGAIDGDYVLVDVFKDGKSARVEAVLSRRLDKITGTVVKVGNSFFLKPLDKKKQFVVISLEGQHIEGSIVTAKLLEQKSDNYYTGKVVDVFRARDDIHQDASLEAYKCGMPEGFSEKSLQQLETIPEEVEPEDKIGRLDLTSWDIISIDGKDTKDKDDCISYKKLPNGNTLVAVHIAHTPRYAPTGSPLHKDAFRKGNSYYYSGTVEPQYPSKISDGVCSLHEGVERLTKSILMEIDPSGTVVSRSLVPTVIKSRKSMTYEDVNKILDEGIVPKGYEEYVEPLTAMENLSTILWKRRRDRGAIEFEQLEPYFIYDKNGEPIDIGYRERGSAQSLIEEFMLLANVNVGEILTEAGIPCVYRIHGIPSLERLEAFLKLLDAVGYPFYYKASEIIERKELMQQLAYHVSCTGHLSDMLTTRLIECMSHASYSTELSEHYGTGFDIYVHFTSPIRRLADDTLSRIIDDCYFEQDPVKKEKAIAYWKEHAPEYAKQASEMEKVAEDVERSTFAMDTAKYMKKFVGKTFEATIVSLNSDTIEIQLDNLLLGRIRVSSLPGNYVYNKDTFTLLPFDEGPPFYLGDRIKVRLTSSNVDAKKVDFAFLEKLSENRIKDPSNSNEKVKSKARDELFKKNFKGN